MLLPVRGYAASILSFTLAIQFTPSSVSAEELTVFDAMCLKRQMEICVSLLSPINPQGNGPNPGFFLRSTYPDCVQRSTYIKGKPSTHPYHAAFKGTWPLGCGRKDMINARSISDCAEVGRTHQDCVKKINVLSASDVQLARESFTAQLDAWLKMLENAGVVDLDQALEAMPAASPPSDN